MHLDHPGVTLESDVQISSLRLGDICIPTESIAVISHPSGIVACKIPDFSGLSSGSNPTDLTPIHSWPDQEEPGPDVECLVSEVIYDSLSPRELNLYYLRGSTPLATIINIAINTSEGELTVSEQNPSIALNASDILSPNKGLYFDNHMNSSDDGVHYTVIPLKDFTLRDPRKILQMFVSPEEFGQASQPINVDSQRIDVDEATGRVIIWEGLLDSKLFVGDLV